jgi:hypothetical protein
MACAVLSTIKLADWRTLTIFWLKIATVTSAHARIIIKIRA